MRAFPRGPVSALFFMGALGCLLITSWQPWAVMWWLGLTLLAILTAQNRQDRFVLGSAGAALAAFALFLLLKAVFLNPAYRYEAVYYAATFLISFLFASRCHDWLTRQGFRLFCAAVALIAGWAVAQWMTGWGFPEGGSRSQALFATPNTLATLVNLALAPLLAHYLLGRGSRRAYGLLLLLFAGLLSAQSRGGYLGLLVAMLFFMSYVGKTTILSNLRHYGAVLLGFLGVMTFFHAYAWVAPRVWGGSARWSLDNVAATLLHGEHSGRFEIYGMAWPLFVEHFWQGIGYFNFGYYFERYKTAPYLESSTHFVHNDYLQLALETGVLGIGLFVGLIVLACRNLLRYRSRVIEEGRLPVVLPAVAATSMLAHAWVDFPFYIPLLIAVFAVCVGVLDRQFVALSGRVLQWPELPRFVIPGLRRGFVGGLMLLLALGWLGLPAAAEAAAAYGLQRLRQGDVAGGLYWHQLARGLQPHDAGYCWREGVILRDWGTIARDPALAVQADAAFAQGIAINPFEIDNWLARLALQREHRDLLPSPATDAELLDWAAQAKRLQPYSAGVEMEAIRVLAFTGRREKAIIRARRLLEMRPQSEPARRLLREVSAT